MSFKSVKECQEDRTKLKNVLMSIHNYKPSDIEDAFIEYGVCNLCEYISQSYVISLNVFRLKIYHTRD